MFATRSYIKEEMDNFDTNKAVLNDSLNRLSFINRILGNTSVTLNAVKKVLKSDPEKVFHIVDIGCGAGDNLRAIATWCFENNRAVRLTGLDGNSQILSYAKQQQSATEIRYQQADILNSNFELESCNILISSHFIYRFTDKELVAFLNGTKKKVEDTIIFSELRRSIIPYYLFRIFGRVFFFNRMVRHDGLKAIKNSFNKKELEKMMQALTVASYRLEKKWAFRFLITIKM